jgi:hypothetical protein
MPHPTAKIRHNHKDVEMSEGTLFNSVGFIGVLPDDPDRIPITPPCGLFWINPAAVSDGNEMYGLAEVRVALKGQVLDFAITLADAIAIHSLLEEAIDAMIEVDDATVEHMKTKTERTQ